MLEQKNKTTLLSIRVIIAIVGCCGGMYYQLNKSFNEKLSEQKNHLVSTFEAKLKYAEKEIRTLKKVNSTYEFDLKSKEKELELSNEKLLKLDLYGKIGNNDQRSMMNRFNMLIQDLKEEKLKLETQLSQTLQELDVEQKVVEEKVRKLKLLQAAYDDLSNGIAFYTSAVRKERNIQLYKSRRKKKYLMEEAIVDFRKAAVYGIEAAENEADRISQLLK